MATLVHLHVKNPKDDETPIESAVQIFASLLPRDYYPLAKRAIFPYPIYAFEIYLLQQTVYFYVTCEARQETLVKSLVTAAFPTAVVTKTTDPMALVTSQKNIVLGEEVLNAAYMYPVKTYLDYEDVDPLASLVGFLGRQPRDIQAAVQIALKPASFPWAARAMSKAKAMFHDVPADKYTHNPEYRTISRKAAFQGGKACIRIVVSSNTHSSLGSTLHNLGGTFGSFSLGEGNQFIFKRRYATPQILLSRIKARAIRPHERHNQILNAQELATIWHPPGFLLAGVKNITWGKTLKGEPPESLPVVDSVKNKEDANFFAKCEFRNKNQIFGIKTEDRRKHIYVIGKTGAGKSTLIANMAIDDIRRGRGIGIIDPHGDLSNIILEYIPRRRIRDVVYLEPFDTARPFSLNVLEVKNKQHRDLVASGIVSIFNKIYGESWGPRLEYILRNCILTLLEVEGCTLPDILKLLADKDFRDRTVAKLTDPVLSDFWTKEFAKMPDNLRAEAISPIQNKVGQFVSSRMIRNIIGEPKSSIDLQKIMDEGKILILNLSQGKLGEDNAALLGAMIITQIQLAAMNRAYVDEDARRDFFLYVDEFQNFATTSFIKILSEARKYRLSLTLANQYIEQIEEDVTKAIFGNVGTLITFVIGARDAYPLSKEYSELYTEGDLVSLGKYEIVLKLSVDGQTSAPFPATTVPLPSLRNDNSKNIIKLSKEKFGRNVKT